jgi:ribosomal-protein-alanine N-acetyltransferase
LIAPADDIDLIMAIMAAAFDPAYGEAWSRRQVEDALLTGNCHYGLAMHQDLCAGFFLTRSACDEEELLLLAVSPQFRRKGIGQQLIDRFRQEARQRGAVRLFLEMRRGNPAESLYLKNNFARVGVRPNYYRTKQGDRLDAITFTSEIE